MKMKFENGIQKCSKTLLLQLLVNDSVIFAGLMAAYEIILLVKLGKMENLAVSYKSRIFTWILSN